MEQNSLVVNFASFFIYSKRCFYASSHQRYSVKKGVVLKISEISQKNHLCWSLFLIKLEALACNVTEKETLAQAVSLWILWIFWEHLFIEHLRASVKIGAAIKGSFAECVFLKNTKKFWTIPAKVTATGFKHTAT